MSPLRHAPVGLISAAAHGPAVALSDSEVMFVLERWDTRGDLALSTTEDDACFGDAEAALSR